MKNKLIVGIDASRNRSGGAKAHIIGILENLEPTNFGISEVHIWSFQSLLDNIPNKPWLVKHNPVYLEKNLLFQLFWQYFILKSELKLNKVNILFASDASSLCNFTPMVVLSQDMLSYEPGIMSQFGIGFARLRLLMILIVQNIAFRRAQGVIFLTKYAGNVIQSSCGLLNNVCYIPHGIGATFKNTNHIKKWPQNNSKINFIYISPIIRYKEHLNLIKAFEIVSKLGYNVELNIIGEILDNKYYSEIQSYCSKSKSNFNFIKFIGPIDQNKLPRIISESDVFVFASSCENMPITLLEGMAIGIPVISSSLGPMKEVLQDAGTYFNPKDIQSISNSIITLIENESLRLFSQKKSQILASEYSWSRCSIETFTYIKNCHKKYIDEEN